MARTIKHALEQFGVQATVDGNTIRVTFPGRPHSSVPFLMRGAGFTPANDTLTEWVCVGESRPASVAKQVLRAIHDTSGGAIYFRED